MILQVPAKKVFTLRSGPATPQNTKGENYPHRTFFVAMTWPPGQAGDKVSLRCGYLNYTYHIVIVKRIYIFPSKKAPSIIVHSKKLMLQWQTRRQEKNGQNV